jgi:hypothetical protein
MRLIQELQNNCDNRVGLKGMKAVRPYMKEIIVSDGEGDDGRRGAAASPNSDPSRFYQPGSLCQNYAVFVACQGHATLLSMDVFTGC